jgi:hypothetical protein
MKRTFKIKKEIKEKKKRTAKLKDCPNKLISLLGVKKTPRRGPFSLSSISQSQMSASFFFFF